MNTLSFDKTHYLELAKQQGFQMAINQLHHDLWELEKECFETDAGYQADVWKRLNEMRIFSRELWDIERSS